MSIDYPKIQRHLGRRDAVLRRLIKVHGPCTLTFESDHFAVLARAIVAQQISSKAARSISERLLKTLGRRGLTPRAVLAIEDEALRDAGLSGRKSAYLKDLASKAHSGELHLQSFPDMRDEDIIAELTSVKGIGPWTADMFLIFSLGRLDVLPVGDFGLRTGVQREYALENLPEKARLIELAEPWRPYRSVATWYFWRSFGPVPQSDK